MKAHRRGSTLSLTSALDEGGWLKPRALPLYPRERHPVPTVQEAEWAPGTIWAGAENLATGIRSPDRPDRSKSL